MDLIPYFFYCAHIIVLLLLLDCDFSGPVSNGFNDTRLQLGLLLSLLLLLLLYECIHAARTRLGLFDESRATFHVKTRPLRRPSGSCCCYICTPFFLPSVHPSTPLPSEGEEEEEEEETDDVVAVVVIVESLVKFSILYRPLLLLLYSSCLVEEEEGDG